MRALVRRRAGRATSTLVAGGVELDAETHELRHGDAKAVLSAREYALMHALMERPGRILSRHATRGAHLRLGRGGGEQRRRRSDPFRPAQVRQDDHPQRPGRRMDAPEILTTASLRRTALVYVTVLLSVIGLAASAFAYLYAHDAATEFLDGQLRQIALNAGGGVSPADAPAEADQDPEDQFAVSIWDAKGRLVHASLPSVHIPPQTRPGYANAEAAGEEWRVYTTGDSAAHGSGRAARSGAPGNRADRGARGGRAGPDRDSSGVARGRMGDEPRAGAAERACPMSLPSAASARRRRSRSTGFPQKSPRSRAA